MRSPRELAPLIDHTVLGVGAGAVEVERACDEALELGFAGVCVREAHLARVVRRLVAGGGVRSAAATPGEASGPRAPLAIAVADFPAGLGSTAERVAEAARLAALGAEEVDIVYPMRALRERRHRDALRDLEAVVRALGAVALKVILETAALGDAEKAAACSIASAAGAAFVKTSTGFGPGGATEGDVRLLRELAGPGVGVKASGGIRTAADALRMVRAGASRLGTSASVAIVTGSF
jgi:deoxyribose-phosphate aldolase